MQDIEHVWWECKGMEQTRRCVLDSAEGLMGMWGSDNEKARWSGMSEKEKLMHSVGVKKLFSAGLEQKLKSHAAKLWVDGFVMFVSRLENTTFSTLN